MASQAKWVWFAALCAGLVVVVAACNGKGGGYPPPKPASTGGAGGAGGAGGSTGGSGGSAVNFCECSFEFTYGTEECGTCVNNQNDASKGHCSSPLGKCTDNQDCAKIVLCPLTCFTKMTPPAEQVACIQACFVPFTDDKAHQLAASYLTCVCQHCASECAPQMPVTCE